MIAAESRSSDKEKEHLRSPKLVPDWDYEGYHNPRANMRGVLRKYSATCKRLRGFALPYLHKVASVRGERIHQTFFGNRVFRDNKQILHRNFLFLQLMAHDRCVAGCVRALIFNANDEEHTKERGAVPYELLRNCFGRKKLAMLSAELRSLDPDRVRDHIERDLVARRREADIWTLRVMLLFLLPDVQSVSFVGRPGDKLLGTFLDALIEAPNIVRSVADIPAFRNLRSLNIDVSRRPGDEPFNPKKLTPLLLLPTLRELTAKLENKASFNAAEDDETIENDNDGTTDPSSLRSPVTEIAFME